MRWVCDHRFRDEDSKSWKKGCRLPVILHLLRGRLKFKPRLSWGQNPSPYPVPHASFWKRSRKLSTLPLTSWEQQKIPTGPSILTAFYLKRRWSFWFGGSWQLTLPDIWKVLYLPLPITVHLHLQIPGSLAAVFQLTSIMRDLNESLLNFICNRSYYDYVWKKQNPCFD